jgi:hypothetical protein
MRQDRGRHQVDPGQQPRRRQRDAGRLRPYAPHPDEVRETRRGGRRGDSQNEHGERGRRADDLARPWRVRIAAERRYLMGEPPAPGLLEHGQRGHRHDLGGEARVNAGGRPAHR